MSNTNQIDEIMISAFVDNQVDVETRVAIVKAMDEDDDFRYQQFRAFLQRDLGIQEKPERGAAVPRLPGGLGAPFATRAGP